MARIQILPLPTQRVGDYERIPFVLILDQVSRFEEDFPDEWIEQIKQATGAALVIAHEATLDAPGALELTEEQKEQLLADITAPAQYVTDIRYTDADDHITRVDG